MSAKGQKPTCTPRMPMSLVAPVRIVPYVWHVKEYPEKHHQDDNRENNSKTISHTRARLELCPMFIAPWYFIASNGEASASLLHSADRSVESRLIFIRLKHFQRSVGLQFGGVSFGPKADVRQCEWNVC